ncbi:MAG: adenylate kinase [Clostridia bacterium]
MKLVLLGAPGSGKGTQAEKLSALLGIPTISTGAIIRAHINGKTELGLKATSYIQDGKLVPDELVLDIVKDRLSKDDCKNGFILDGFPRTIPQAEEAERLGFGIERVLDLYVSDEAIVDRLSGRRECKVCRTPFHTVYNAPHVDGICDKCGGELIRRADDEPETIRKRLEVYHKETEPLENFYKERGILTVVEGRKKIEDTTRDVRKALGLD